MAAWTEALVRGSYAGALALFAAAVALIALGQLWVFPLGGLSSVGLASICALYVLGEHRFRSRGAGPLESMVLAVLFANAFLQSYEIVYGLSFFPPMTGTELRTVILWLLMVSPLLLVRRYLRFGRASGAALAAFAAVWAVWLLYGFPQYYVEGYPFPQVLRTGDPFHLSLWLNFGSKAILAAFYASLLEPAEGARALVRWGRRTGDSSSAPSGGARRQ